MKREESLLDIARRALQERRERVASMESSLSDPAFELKGHVVELWRAGDRFFLVADAADARLVVERGWGNRGEVWTAAEVERVATIRDQEARNEIERWKRTCDGAVRDANV